MKTYVILLSRQFPKGHKKEGQPTFFKEKFMFGQQCQFCPPKDRDTNYPECDECLKNCDPAKVHTIRTNYDLWAKRFEEVERDEACISVREWTDKPYRSSQIEIARLTKEHGIGIQKIELTNDLSECIIRNRHFNYVEIAKNDGLPPDDWLDLFKVHNIFKPMAIIHFTKSRYGNKVK